MKRNEAVWDRLVRVVLGGGLLSLVFVGPQTPWGIVGILPLVSTRHANFLHHEVPGIFIPEETRKRVEAAGENGAAVGVELAVELIQSIKPWAGGVYIMPQFSRYDMVAEIIEMVK
jgi:homocysteine S-methyltransferase